VSTARKPEVADNRRMLVPACKPFDPTSLTISSRKNPFSPSFSIRVHPRFPVAKDLKLSVTKVCKKVFLVFSTTSSYFFKNPAFARNTIGHG